MRAKNLIYLLFITVLILAAGFDATVKYWVVKFDFKSIILVHNWEWQDDRLADAAVYVMIVFQLSYKYQENSTLKEKGQTGTILNFREL